MEQMTEQTMECLLARIAVMQDCVGSSPFMNWQLKLVYIISTVSFLSFSFLHDSQFNDHFNSA
jgi:hypothetical protein